MHERARELLHFIDASPTPWHAVEVVRSHLEAAGYRALDEREVWSLEAGEKVYVIRGGSSLAAFELGRRPPSEGGFRLVGAHTDSPNLRLKPKPRKAGHGMHQLAVEPYGGVLLHTWFDRDLTISGRVALRTDDGVVTRLIRFDRPLARIPSLAIHLNREVNAEGLKVDAQRHLPPLLAIGDELVPREMILQEVARDREGALEDDDLLGFDLCLHDFAPSALGGAREELIFAPRLDNLASCHAGLAALLDAKGPVDATRGIVLYDHEEVGSTSPQGADSPFLADALCRIAGALGEGEGAKERAFARSFLISADMAHALHPNYADRHEPGHRPLLGQGPVIKTNSNQRYATDAESAARFTAWCRAAGFSPQHFVTRSDLACGSTIGPITAGRLGIRTVDVGNPMLSMHSCREMAGAADVAPMIDAMRVFFETDD